MQRARVKNKERKIFNVILFLAVAVYVISFNSNLSISGDDESYFIILAKSLSSGYGYSEIHKPGNPPASKSPPGLPLLLTPVIFIFPNSITILKLFALIFSIFAIIIFFYFLKNEGEHNAFLLVGTFLFALNPLVVSYSHFVMSEMPYILFSLLSLLAFDRYIESKRETKRYKYLLLAFSTAILLFYTRHIGITFISAMFIFLLYKKEFRLAVILSILVTISIIPWIYQGRLSSIVGLYIKEHSLYTFSAFFPSIYRFFYHALAYLTVHIVDLFFYPLFMEVLRKQPVFIFKFVLGLSISMVICYGFITQIRRKIKLYHFYIVIYAMLIFFYQIRSERYLLGIFPFLLYYLLIGLKELSGYLGWIKKGTFVSCIVTLLLIDCVGCIYLIYKERTAYYSPQEKSYLACVEWIKKNTPPDTVVLCRKPRFLYLYSGRKAYMYTATKDYKVFKDTLNQEKINYIILDSLTSDADYLKSFICEYKESLELVYTTEPPINYVYKVKNIR